ncbi:MAG: hypothetical protein LBP85_00180 [Prevotellaceae bacterium]|jgi:hypothetical protein|nr:hypothetical protein [Prevotellaceae bacterium]
MLRFILKILIAVKVKNSIKKQCKSSKFYALCDFDKIVRQGNVLAAGLDYAEM